MRIPKEDTAAVVVDVQERLFPHIHDHEQLEQNLVKLIQGVKILGLPLIVTQQYTRGLGPTIPAVAEAVGEFTPLEKLTFSCCGDQGFMDAVKALGRKHILLMGIEAHVCVLQTALDLLEQGFQPVVIEDCISSRRLNDKRVALRRMIQEGVMLSTYESILFELCMVAGTDQFKAISRLVK
ncbi:MAG: hydrolase [Calditrichaeota bacterium]|nr:MAG: hydrolase [Calditrichota bacterium]